MIVCHVFTVYAANEKALDPLGTEGLPHTNTMVFASKFSNLCSRLNFE
uniref:Uncharacterized protein n=1 Tax=Pseudomonas phage HRDY3 TaxID=3236930 RepID=A0AB39CEC0_9VIRU